MRETEDYDFVHAFISSSREAVFWGFWHAARWIYQKSQRINQPEVSQKRSISGAIGSLFGARQIVRQTEFVVGVMSGARENALMLMYRGVRLDSQEVLSVVGLDINKDPFSGRVVARGKSEIRRLERTLMYGPMNMGWESAYESNTGIPDDFLVQFHPPPKDLHPSTWSQLGTDIRGPIPPEFTEPELPLRNPATAFSRYANELRCAYCGKINVAPQWPSHGDLVGFYYQTLEESEEVPGAYRIGVHCPYCHRDWYVVWDRNPT